MNSRCVIACYHLGGPGCPLCSLAPVNSVAQKYSIRPSPREGLRVQRLRIRDEMMAATDGFTSRDDARASTQAVQPHSHVKTLRSARVGWVLGVSTTASGDRTAASAVREGTHQSAGLRPTSTPRAVRVPERSDGHTV